MSQPTWKCIANLGDVDYLEYGGYFVFEDTTGVYPPEAELLQEPCEDETRYTVHRFVLEPCTFVDGVLSDNASPTHSAWFADSLQSIADFVGMTYLELVIALCDTSTREGAIKERAHAWRAIGDYHGFDNLDSYPLMLTRAEADARYRGTEK